MSGVKLVLCGVGGEPTGESHFRAHPEAKVTKARELRAQGWNLQAIADYLDGPHRTTVSRWISGKTRNKTVRVVARRIKSEQLVAHHEQAEKTK